MDFRCRDSNASLDRALRKGLPSAFGSRDWLRLANGNQGIPIFYKSLFENLRAKILVCAVDDQSAPILNALRRWVGSAERQPEHLFWTSCASAIPHVVLICGAIRGAGDRLLLDIARWRRDEAFVIWVASNLSEASREDRRVVAAVNATVSAQPLSSLRASEKDQAFRIVRAARGLLQPLLSEGGICVDLADIKYVLTRSKDRIVYRFDVSQGLDAVANADPVAGEIISRAKGILLATSFPESSDWLKECDRFVDLCRPFFPPMRTSW
jgi:hypothetical protein